MISRQGEFSRKIYIIGTQNIIESTALESKDGIIHCFTHENEARHALLSIQAALITEMKNANIRNISAIDKIKINAINTGARQVHCFLLSPAQVELLDNLSIRNIDETIVTAALQDSLSENMIMNEYKPADEHKSTFSFEGKFFTLGNSSQSIQPLSSQLSLKR